MSVLKVKKNGVWEDVAGGMSAHTHTTSDITDFPTEFIDQTARDAASAAQTAADNAAANSWMLSGGTVIAENTDLHTITEIGNYYCYLTNTAKTLTNCPVVCAFTMKVACATGTGFTSANQYRYISAELRPHTVSEGPVWYADAISRDYGATWTWSEWHQVADAADLVWLPPNWPRNTINNFLLIRTTGSQDEIYHRPEFFGSESPATDFSSCPYTSGPFYGYRMVYKPTTHLTMVELHEVYPVAGRVWTNTYDVNAGAWRGWGHVMTTAGGTFTGGVTAAPNTASAWNVKNISVHTAESGELTGVNTHGIIMLRK